VRKPVLALRLSGAVVLSHTPCGATAPREHSDEHHNRLLHLPFLEGVYVGGSLEVGKVGDPFVPGSPTGTLSSVSAFFGFDSLIGPMYLGAGVASNGSSSFYFFLGRP